MNENIEPVANEVEAHLKEAFGATVAKRRVGGGYEQRAFARLAGISNSHLRKIESGETSPTLVTVAKIAADLVGEACRRIK